MCFLLLMVVFVILVIRCLECLGVKLRPNERRALIGVVSGGLQAAGGGVVAPLAPLVTLAGFGQSIQEEEQGQNLVVAPPANSNGSALIDLMDSAMHETSV